MFKKGIQKILSAVFKGAVLPVLSSQLKGLYLKVDPLMPGNLFWNNAEEEVHNLYRIFIKSGFVVFDIGANVGLHSYYISRRIKNTVVYAFEPFQDNAEYIREMVALNKISNITVVEKAAGEFSGNAYFDASINNHQGHITVKKNETVVSVISLDDFISINNVQPDLIKIDVEGSEGAVLEGFKKSITMYHPTIIVEVHNREEAKKVGDFFRPLQYTLCKLMYANKSNSNRPLYIIDNSEINPDAYQNINGQIVAIPAKNLAAVNSFIYSA